MHYRKNYGKDFLIYKSTVELQEKELGKKSVCAYDCEVLGEQVNKVYLDAKHTRQGRVDMSPAFSPWVADTQMTEVTERISCQVFMQINEKKCTFLQDGVPVTHLKLNGETETIRAHIMDFTNVNNNGFITIREFWIRGTIHKRRADMMCFVNGLPIIFIELKSHNQDIRNAYTDNYRDYLDTTPHLFHHNAMIMLSNGMESRAGMLGTKEEFLQAYKVETKSPIVKAVFERNL